MSIIKILINQFDMPGTFFIKLDDIDDIHKYECGSAQLYNLYTRNILRLHIHMFH